VDHPKKHDDVGRRLFARYAHAPNALGYCGPAAAAALRDVACGGGEGVDVRAIARQFSGAWPYQEVIAQLSGSGDPLDAAVVRGYWTGNDLTLGLDREAFWRALLARIKPQAGRYWDHLTDELLVEAAPTHAFHVLAVYPWSRLLGAGPEPLRVLESCRIGWGRGSEVAPDHFVVSSSELEFDGTSLTLGSPHDRKVERLVEGRAFVGEATPGDIVALHWGFACDVLSEEEAGALEQSTQWQLSAMAARLAAR